MRLFPTSLPKVKPNVKPKVELGYILLSEIHDELSTPTCESTGLGYEYSQYKKLIIESLINAFRLYNTPINDTGGDRVLTANLLIGFGDREKLLNYFNFEEFEEKRKIHYLNREADAEDNKILPGRSSKRGMMGLSLS